MWYPYNCKNCGQPYDFEYEYADCCGKQTFETKCPTCNQIISISTTADCITWFFDPNFRKSE